MRLWPALLFALALPLAADPIPVVVSTDKPLHSFDPTVAFGATIDAHAQGENAEVFTPDNLKAMVSAGFHRLSYRLMTELGGEAWHWNPEGSWSDARRQQGYWTSSDSPASPIALSFGYRLPRRGNTLDQARNDSYSRIDDGDPSTFWKSNPYLDEHFAGDAHPQWVLADFGSVQSIDAVRIAWGAPFAVDYRVQYWSGDDAIHMPQEGKWVDFPSGVIRGNRGETATRKLSAAPLRVRYVRLLMTRSSHTSSAAGGDFRDRAGFAVRELSLGRLTRGRFFDRIRHGRRRDAQTLIWVSSTDPWHRASDRDVNTEQLGFDALYATDLTRGRPVLMPVALLYGTPDDAAAEIRWLRRRGHPVAQIEMGEEPDGQEVVPEDYAALYRQWAVALHAVDPALQLGGPAFQSTVDRTPVWPDARGRTSWIGRFVDDLRSHGQLGDFNFFSFEWYPFDDLCASPQGQIVRAPSMLMPVLRRWVSEGLPETIPWIASEYGYSSYGGRADVDLHAAIVDAEFVAQFLSAGGTAAYFYGIEPEVLIPEARCSSWGNLMFFQSDEEHRILHAMPVYWAHRLLTGEWAAASGEHTIHETTVGPSAGLVTAYGVRRPDGKWSVMLFNKSDRRSEAVEIRFRSGGEERPFRGSVAVVEYSSIQYQWHAAGEKGHPTRALPPARSELANGAASLELPPHAITVVTGTF